MECQNNLLVGGGPQQSDNLFINKTSALFNKSFGPINKFWIHFIFKFLNYSCGYDCEKGNASAGTLMITAN